MAPALVPLLVLLLLLLLHARPAPRNIASSEEGQEARARGYEW
jgi:hypothetical protein